MITNDSRKELFHGSLGLLTSAFHLLAREVAVTYLRPWRAASSVPRRHGGRDIMHAANYDQQRSCELLILLSYSTARRVQCVIGVTQTQIKQELNSS